MAKKSSTLDKTDHSPQTDLTSTQIRPVRGRWGAHFGKENSVKVYGQEVFNARQNRSLATDWFDLATDSTGTRPEAA